MSICPAASIRRVSSFTRFDKLPSSKPTVTSRSPSWMLAMYWLPSLEPSPRSRRVIVRKCCSARISVGARMAAWYPFSTAASMATAATTVLPLPTSPSNSLFIGRAVWMSDSISSVTRSCASVNENGSESTNAPTPGSPTSNAMPLPSSCHACLRRKTVIWSKNNSSKANLCRAASAASKESG